MEENANEEVIDLEASSKEVAFQLWRKIPDRLTMSKEAKYWFERGVKAALKLVYDDLEKGK